MTQEKIVLENGSPKLVTETTLTIERFKPFPKTGRMLFSLHNPRTKERFVVAGWQGCSEVGSLNRPRSPVEARAMFDSLDRLFSNAEGDA